MKSMTLRRIALVAMAAALATLVGAANASGTALEVGGTPKGEKVEITASLRSGTTSVLSRTDGSFGNTCTESHLTGSTESPYSGSKVTGPISSLSFTSCTDSVTVHKAGKLYVEHIAGTTNGTVSSEEAEVTVASMFGNLNCKTNAGTDIGTLTGKKKATRHWTSTPCSTAASWCPPRNGQPPTRSQARRDWG